MIWPSAQGVYAAGDVQKPAKGVKAARTGCVFSDAFVVTLYTLPEGFIGRFCQLIANVSPQSRIPCSSNSTMEKQSNVWCCVIRCPLVPQ